jgi:hypothetical protein
VTDIAKEMREKGNIVQLVCSVAFRYLLSFTDLFLADGSALLVLCSCFWRIAHDSHVSSLCPSYLSDSTIISNQLMTSYEWFVIPLQRTGVILTKVKDSENTSFSAECHTLTSACSCDDHSVPLFVNIIINQEACETGLEGRKAAGSNSK